MAASTHRENSQASKIIADGIRSFNADKRYGNLLQNRQWENSGALLLNTPTRFRENGHHNTPYTVTGKPDSGHCPAFDFNGRY